MVRRRMIKRMVRKMVWRKFVLMRMLKSMRDLKS